MKIKIDFSGKQYEIEIIRSHYLRRLGYPKDYDVPEHIQESIDWAVEWYKKNGDPWIQIYELGVEYDGNELKLNKLTTQAPKVSKRFKKYEVNKAMLIAATAGVKADEKITELWSTDFPDRSFFLEAYASSVTETLIEFAVKEIKIWAGYKNMKVLSRYSPGYPGWELKEQQVLMKLVEELKNGKVPVSISDSHLLSPLKSQLSLVGLHTGEREEKIVEIECMQCTFNDCACRKKEMYIKNN